MGEAPQMKIRFMKANDVDKIEEFYNSIIDFKYTHSTYAKIISPTSTSLVITKMNEKQKEEIVGMSTCLRVWHSRTAQNRESYLSTFAISPEIRGKGIGRYLLQLTLFILNHHYKCINCMLDVPKYDYETFDFFRKNGFNAQRVCNDFYGMKTGKKEASVFMLQKLNNVTAPENKFNFRIEDDVQCQMNSVSTLGFFEKYFANP